MKHPQNASRDASEYTRQRTWHVLVIGGASGSGIVIPARPWVTAFERMLERLGKS